MPGTVTVCTPNYLFLKLNSNYSVKTHVCICETWLKENYLPYFINYTPFFVHRLNRQGGGLVILVRNDVPVKKKDLILFSHGHLEIQAVTVFSNKTELDIVNKYILHVILHCRV